jgi:acetyl esterase/lipase
MFLLAAAVALTAFVPAASAQPKPPDDVELIRNVEFGKGGTQPLRLHIVRPKKQPAQPMPALVYINGSAWMTDNKDIGIPKLFLAAQHGYFCVTIQHRTSKEAVFPAQIEDAKCAVRYLRAKAKEYHIDPDQIGAWGGSSGGHLSAMLATTADHKELEGKGGWAEFSSKIQAAVAYCPAIDFFTSDWPERHNQPKGPVFLLLGGDPRKDKGDLAKKASPLTYLTKQTAPILVVHGDKDTTVPPEQGKLLYDALQKAGVESSLKILAGKRHEELDPRNELAMPFFDKHLKSTK